MKILLVGEYSNVFTTLAKGFRLLGHQVTTISNGDLWKNYPRDIDIGGRTSRQILIKVLKNLTKMTGYDVVQIVNPAFIFSGSGSVNINKYVFLFLKQMNGKVFLSAIGDDYYWVNACLKNRFRYSAFDIDKEKQIEFHFNLAYLWSEEKYKNVNNFIADKCDGIIAGCVDYSKAYEFSPYAFKLHRIPFPILIDKIENRINQSSQKFKFFLGIQNGRKIWKGMDVVDSVLDEVYKKYPRKVEVKKVVSLPYNEYKKVMVSSDALIDQLYSYSPGMNGLTAMGNGLILIGGGESEMYDFVNETENRPIINIIPNEEQIYDSLACLVNLPRARIEELKEQSIKFVVDNHDYIKIAEQYINIYIQ